MIYNVRDFGAAGDGIHLDSPNVQMAADLCKENGGGTVYFPSGLYLCASMRIYDNTRVYIDAGATILMSDDEDAYCHPRGKYDEYFTRDPHELIGDKLTNITDENMAFHCGQRLYLQCFRNKTDNLFFVKDAENVTIEGSGVLDGQQMKFFHPEEYGQDISLPRWSRRPDEISFFVPRLFRPHTIVFMNCKNVRLSGLKMLRSPLFNVRVLDSVDAHIDHIVIDGDFRCINSDGINIAGSRNVFVDSCNIACGDDCIAISDAEIQPRTQDTENIIVSNCVFNTTCNMARIFSGIDLDPAECVGIVLPENAKEIGRHQRVRNVVIANCLMLGGATALNIHATYGGIEDIQISNLTTRHSHRAPVVFIGAKDDAYIRDVRIDGLRSSGHSAIGISAMDGAQVEDISISNSKLTISPTTSVFGFGLPDSMNDYLVLDFGPYNIHMRHAKNVCLDNIELRWGKDDLDDMNEISDHYMLSDFYKAQWRPDMEPTLNWPAVYGFDCDNVKLRGMKLTAHGDCEAVRLENCVNVTTDA